MNVDRQVGIFNDTILNIMSNFILDKVITFDDRETKWMNDDIRIKIKGKKTMFIKSSLQIPITLLHFPNTIIQAKNWLYLPRNLEINIPCIFQTN